MTISSIVSSKYTSVIHAVKSRKVSMRALRIYRHQVEIHSIFLFEEMSSGLITSEGKTPYNSQRERVGNVIDRMNPGIRILPLPSASVFPEGV